MNTFRWRWNDPHHLEAHRAEFSASVESILDELAQLIPDANREDESWIHQDFKLSQITGFSGLKRLDDEQSDFWAYRKGRTIPSHLIHGERRSTYYICLWGWCEKGEFVIHTLYPGRKAPREIHDPKLHPSEMKKAIDFWCNHAIITTKGEYSFEAYN